MSVPLLGASPGIATLSLGRAIAPDVAHTTHTGGRDASAGWAFGTCLHGASRPVCEEPVGE